MMFIRGNSRIATFGFAIVASLILFTGLAAVQIRSEAHKTGAKPLRLLFLGNSHTTVHNIPELVKRMVESAGSYQVEIQTFGAGFLENLATNRTVRESIQDGNWDFVILQGQKISMSGKFIYSTEGAESLSNLAKKSSSKAIWFCEWGRQDVAGESERIQKIYEEIAVANNDLIAPIGKVWDSVLEARPNLALHALDGNHSNATGAYLTALTLSCLLTESDCRQLPNTELNGIDDELQVFLKSSVYEATRKRVVQKPATGK